MKSATNSNEWRKRQQKMEAQYGPLYSFIIEYNDKHFHLKDVPNNPERASLAYFEKVVDCAQDFLKKPLQKTNVLDLACMEGVASFAFAKRGAKKITAIDGRAVNIAKATFVQELLGYTNIDFQEKDVRSLNFPEKSFDVVLALGILYHLDIPDLFHFVEKIYEWTRHVAIIDTHVALLPNIQTMFKEKNYSGLYYQEHHETFTNEAAVGNSRSFWLTRPSLYNLLSSVGFTGIYENRRPDGNIWRETNDRVTIILTKSTSNVKKWEGFQERDPHTIIAGKTNIDALIEYDAKLRVT